MSIINVLLFSLSYASSEVYTYSYDLDNKLENITQSLNKSNSNKAIKLTYDANGNMTDDGLGNTYTYDLENELVNYFGRSDNTETTATYTYYPNHMRADKRINNGQVVNFYYNGNKYAQIVNESIGNSDYTSYAMLGNNRYVRIVHQSNNLNSSDTLQYLIKDNKNIIAKLGSTGDINSSYAYDPYGKEVNLDKAKQINKVKESSGFSLVANPFGYESEYKDSESGLIYLRARYYSPQLMRFISRDTTDLPNRYEYADGNPISNVDPSGHWSIIKFFKSLFKRTKKEIVDQPIDDIEKIAENPFDINEYVASLFDTSIAVGDVDDMYAITSVVGKISRFESNNIAKKGKTNIFISDSRAKLKRFDDPDKILNKEAEIKKNNIEIKDIALKERLSHSEKEKFTAYRDTKFDITLLSGLGSRDTAEYNGKTFRSLFSETGSNDIDDVIARAGYENMMIAKQIEKNKQGFNKDIYDEAYPKRGSMIIEDPNESFESY